ncbi:hypothetical protein BDW22DRAFT_1421826 [Trametopsis cervina]|nr:hypothetical protein BDW22DRAFT_1421826 [Trametopsis cervina]
MRSMHRVLATSLHSGDKGASDVRNVPLTRGPIWRVRNLLYCTSMHASGLFRLAIVPVAAFQSRGDHRRTSPAICARCCRDRKRNAESLRANIPAFGNLVSSSKTSMDFWVLVFRSCSLSKVEVMLRRRGVHSALRWISQEAYHRCSKGMVARTRHQPEPRPQATHTAPEEVEGSAERFGEPVPKEGEPTYAMVLPDIRLPGRISLFLTLLAVNTLHNTLSQMSRFRPCCPLKLKSETSMVPAASGLFEVEAPSLFPFSLPPALPGRDWKPTSRSFGANVPVFGNPVSYIKALTFLWVPEFESLAAAWVLASYSSRYRSRYCERDSFPADERVEKSVIQL